MMIKKLAIAAFFVIFSSSIHAAADFVVEDIQVKGLQRVALGAALTHIPFNIGHKVNDFRISQSVKTLFKSGHFNSIVVSPDGNGLIFKV